MHTNTNEVCTRKKKVKTEIFSQLFCCSQHVHSKSFNFKRLNSKRGEKIFDGVVTETFSAQSITHAFIIALIDTQFFLISL